MQCSDTVHLIQFEYKVVCVVGRQQELQLEERSSAYIHTLARTLVQAFCVHHSIITQSSSVYYIILYYILLYFIIFASLHFHNER